MAINYQVKRGDSISSIAYEQGFFPNTIWDHPNNTELKKKRKDMNTLCPGDMVFVPDKRIKEVSHPTNQVHKFKMKGVPALCSLQLFDGNEYRANQDYELEIDSVKHIGKTNSEGVLRVSIPPNAKSGLLIIGHDKAEFKLKFGHLEPPSQIRGIQARLNNLGFRCPVTGNLDDKTKEAISQFQQLFHIEETGEIDDSLIQKLDNLHDNVCDFPDRNKI